MAAADLGGDIEEAPAKMAEGIYNVGQGIANAPRNAARHIRNGVDHVADNVGDAFMTAGADLSQAADQYQGQYPGPYQNDPQYQNYNNYNYNY